MKIKFQQLSENHFELLYKWLRTDHMKLWWDQDIDWTYEKILQKYQSRVDDSLIKAFVIYGDSTPIGYIQYYNRHLHQLEYECDLSFLPESCAGIDLYIGEVEFGGKSYGSTALRKLCDWYIAHEYSYAFVDPDISNLAAINCYKKCGFKEVKSITSCIFMLKDLQLLQ